MIDAQATNSSFPTADEYAGAMRRRRARYVWLGLLLATISGLAYIALDRDNLVIPLAFLVFVITPILLWRYPVYALYMVFAAVCLFETGATTYPDEITGRVPFFWNINTIFQVFAHIDFKAVPLNLMEIFVVTAASVSLIRSVFNKSISLRAGPLLVPILAYMGFVGFGWVNGMMTGGDFKISLQEVRSQFYFLLAYLMAVNIIRERRQILTFLWIMASCIALKGILYTFRRYVTLHGLPLPDQGVGSHEEAFLFDSFSMLLIVLTLFGLHKRLRTFMWWLLPLVITGNLATNRRSATAAFIIGIPVVYLSCLRAMPERRKMLVTVGVLFTLVFSIYYQAFKNSSSMIGQPARAIHSQFAPDARDASSDEYRDAENADLYATIKSSPILGYGYGKRMFHVAKIADISKIYKWWDIMTHNQVLWVWMRVGTIGFFLFWLMVSSILIYCGRMVASDEIDKERKVMAVTAMAIISMLMIFGLLDLQFSNFRDMLFGGIWSGVVAALGMYQPPSNKEASPVAGPQLRRGGGL